MEGNSFRCQAVSWIKMTHLFTKRSAQSALAKQGERERRRGPSGGRSSRAFPACQESLQPSVESHQRGRDPHRPGDRLDCVIRGGRGEARKAVRGRKRLAAPARKLARRVSVTELTSKHISKMIFPLRNLLLKGYLFVKKHKRKLC